MVILRVMPGVEVSIITCSPLQENAMQSRDRDGCQNRIEKNAPRGSDRDDI